MDTKPQAKMSAGKAVLIGHLLVTLPVFLFSGAGGAIGWSIWRTSTAAMIGVAAGAMVAWLWWSAVIPRWRRWAHQSGADPAKLQKWAAATGLVWPKGWLPEKTEFGVDDPKK